MLRKTVVAAALLLLFHLPAYAFLEDTPDGIEHSIQTLITAAKQGRPGSNQRLADELKQYQALDLKNHSSSEIINQLRHTKTFPDYVFERGSYSYNPGTNYFYVTGRSVAMYSVPIIDSAVVTAKLNTRGTDYLKYLGEWKPQKGSAWVFARMRDSNRTGWIEKRNIKLVPNNTFRQLISDMQEGLQGYNLTTVRTTQRNSEVINTSYSGFTREMGRKIAADIASSRRGNVTARRSLDDTLRMLSGILSRSDLAKKSWSDNDAYVQKLINDRKLDGRLLRAGYKYDESGVIIFTPDSAVVRSQPDAASNAVTSTRANASLRYLGERLTRSGVKYYLADDMKGNIGWISERTSELVPIDAVRAFRDQIEESFSQSRR